jgi:hypothetical protein
LSHWNFKSQTSYRNNVLDWKISKLMAIDHILCKFSGLLYFYMLPNNDGISFRWFDWNPWNELNLNRCECVSVYNEIWNSRQPSVKTQIKSITILHQQATRPETITAILLCFYSKSFKCSCQLFFRVKKHYRFLFFAEKSL